MPRHLVIAAKILEKVSKYAIYETKIWRGLYGPSGRYPGVSNYKQASRGIQHGLAAGSAIGSFISTGDEPPNVYGPNVSTPSQPYKTRSGRGRGPGGRYSKQFRNNRHRRCSCSSKYKSSRYRKRGSRFLSSRRSKSHFRYR